ncbi:MAG: M28 family peptidase [Candidatus Latescibacterota bacterium]
MKRRDFTAILGSFPLLALTGGMSSWAKTPGNGELVDTPEKRTAYIKRLLKELCTEIGPHPAGTPAFARAAKIFKKEMGLSLPVVETDRFEFERWELIGKPEFILGGKSIETYPAFGSEGTPPEGVDGILQSSGGGYVLVDSSTGKTGAQITVSPYGRAVPSFLSRTNPPSLPAFGVGMQDVSLLDDGVRDKTPASLKAKVRFIPNASGANIIGKIPGNRPDEILFIAHADTTYNAPGANDNTASAIVMLMLAHAASGKVWNHTLTFVAADAEEFGCLGAKHYGEKRTAENTMKDIKIAVNFDSLTYGPNLQVHSKENDLKDIIRDIHRDLNIKAEPKFFEDDGYVMDSEPFRPSGGKGMYINSRGYDERTLHLWHRPEDIPSGVPLDCAEIGFLVFNEFIKRADKL